MALNVTTAAIAPGCNTAVASPSLAQWDQGQILQITGVELPETYQVEFSGGGTVRTVPMLGSPAGVEIPNALLQSSHPITAYIVLHEGEDDRETEYWITIYVRPRQAPETTDPDPEQLDIIDQAIAVLNNAAGTAAADALKSEGWAVGEQDGVPVEEGSPYYQNNAEYYAGEAVSLIAKDGLPVYKNENSYNSLLTVYDGADALPIESVLIRFTPKQGGSGTPSPSNVRPITGYTGIGINHGPDAATYNTIAVSWNNPVYAGTVDLISGTLIAEYGVKTYDGSETISAFNSETGYFYIGGLEGAIPVNSYARQSTGWCSHYHVATAVQNNSFGDMSVTYSNNSFSNNNTRVFFKDSRFIGGTAADVKAYIAAQYAAGTPVRVVYKLETPVEYTITGAAANTLPGVNRFWTEQDEFTVKYPVSLDLYSNKLMACVTPQMFGAVGDGVTDDTAAFQAAVNTGKAVHVPTADKQIYKITDTINIPKHCKQLYGDGLFEPTSRGLIVFDLSKRSGARETFENTPLFAVGNTQCFQLSDIKIHSTTLNDNRLGIAIDASTTLADKDIILSNVFISRFLLVTSFRGRGFELYNCRIASVDGIGTFDWDDDDESNANHDPSTGQRRISIRNSALHNIVNFGIRVTSGHAYGLAFENNVVDNGSFSGSNGRILYCNDEAWNWNVSGNVIQGIRANGDASKIVFNNGARGCVFANNVITYEDNYWIGDTTLPHSCLVSTGAFNGCAITGNVFRNFRAACIQFAAGNNTAIAGNVFTTKQQIATSGAIRISGECEAIAITGNSFVSTDAANKTFLSFPSGTKLDNSKVVGNAHNGSNSGLSAVAAASSNLITDET